MSHRVTGLIIESSGNWIGGPFSSLCFLLLLLFCFLFIFAPGAFGYFEVTHDISRYCKARIFERVGKRTPLAVRFSTVGR